MEFVVRCTLEPYFIVMTLATLTVPNIIDARDTKLPIFPRGQRLANERIADRT
jgi:hypothetical protein